MVMLAGIVLSILGTCMYSTMFYLAKRRFGPALGRRKMSECDVLDICCKSVSATHAILSSGAGLVIVFSCRDNMKYDQHFLTNAFACFGFPYFIYDTWCMFHVFRHSESEQGRCFWSQLFHFVSKQPIMVAHHLLLAFVGLPLIIYVRRGLGDYVIGCLYLAELSTPFVSFRAILSKMGMKHSTLYWYNGAAMIAVFFFCRIMVFPFLYFKYSYYANLTILEVIASIPKKCNLSCLGMILLQFYWLTAMVRGALKLTLVQTTLHVKEN